MFTYIWPQCEYISCQLSTEPRDSCVVFFTRSHVYDKSVCISETASDCRVQHITAVFQLWRAVINHFHPFLCSSVWAYRNILFELYADVPVRKTQLLLSIMYSRLRRIILNFQQIKADQM